MDTSIAENGLWQYCKSRFSAADDDRLGQHVRDIPSGITLNVSALTKDSIGDDCLAGFIAEKFDLNRWIIQEHWCFNPGVIVPDSYITHGLLWLLRCRNVKIN